jgi:tetratricopeptide (TPR) repeat protein
MKKFFLYFIPIGLISISLTSLVFGSILPFSKAGVLAGAQNYLSKIKTVEEFKKVFGGVFDFYSPIGDEESAHFTAAKILELIAQNGQPEGDSRAIVDFIEPYLPEEDYTRDIIVSAQMRLVLWEKFQRQSDYELSEKYYLEASVRAPEFPDVLYGLLELYKSKGDKDKLKPIAERIVTLWPEDAETAKLLSNI